MNITPELILSAYCQGLFPMAEDRDGTIDWFSPDPRAIQPFIAGDPLGAFHLKRSLAKQVRKEPFAITTDRCFARVIHACATVPRPEGAGTWINQDGVAIGGAFFGESMFSTRPYASQLCYVWLIEHLRRRGYRLFDVQFTNPHIEQFGVVEVPIGTYLGLLEEAIVTEVAWTD